MLNPGVTITDGPCDWQIIQRDKNNVGSITVKGTWQTTELYFYIQGRIVFEDNGAPVTKNLDWQSAKLNIDTCEFEIKFTDIPSGGLYRIETRLRRPNAGDRRAMRGDYIHHIGVGDIYIITGQSNASGTGKGSANDPIQLGVHIFANDEKWKIAAHPIEDATHTLHPITITSVFHGHSPWLAFGKKLMSRANMPIGLIPAALGGSPISMWVKDDGTPGVLFENMMDMLAKAGGKTAGILWYQGESDAYQLDSIIEYPERFNKLVALFKSKISKDIPIITAQLNRFVLNKEPALDACWSKMREIQRQMAQKFKNVFMVTTLDTQMSDEIHSSAAANIIIGERYADVALEQIYDFNIQSSYPEPEKAKFVDAKKNLITIKFKNVCGDWTPNPAVKEFSVEDTDGFMEIAHVELCSSEEIEVQLAKPANGETALHGLYGINPEISLRDDNCRCITAFSIKVE